MKKIFTFPLSLIVMIMMFAGCAGGQNHDEQKASATINLEHTALPIVGWQMDNSHVAPIGGEVLLGDKPVTGVELSLSGKRSVKTDEDGAFEFLVDRSLPQKFTIHVLSAENAKVADTPLDNQAKEDLLAATGSLQIYYPIQISSVQEAANHRDLVEVHARALPDNGKELPTTTLVKYAIKGTVKTADGAPVEGATVSFVRDNGEGWSKSAPSNDKGEYILYYSPEEDEDLYLNVHVGNVKYSLPENRVYRFPEDTSVQTDIILPEKGTVIADKPPTLVSQPTKGALYWSLLVGIAVDEKVNYTVTLPQKDGSFVLTLPKKVWDQSPSFFETRATKFLDDPIKAGDTVDSSFIPAPQPDDPTGIVPISQK